MKAFIALYVASAREFLRDRLALVITIILPLVFAGFFGLIFGGSGGFRLNVGLAVLDSGPTAQQFVALLKSPELQKVISLTEGEQELLLESLREGKQHIVMVLPADMSQRFLAGQQVVLPVYFDQGRQSSADTGLAIMRSLIIQANLTLAGLPTLLVPEAQPIHTQRASAFDFYVPNMLGMSFLWLGIFGTALYLVQLRETQVLRRLAITPLSRRMVLASQVAWRVSVGIAQAALFLVLGWIAFDLSLPADFALFCFVVLLGAAVFVSIGYFLAAISPSTDSSVAIAQIINFAMTFFSGVLFEPDFLPTFLRPLLLVMPLTYLADALRQTMAGFPPLHPLSLDVAVLIGFLVILVPLTIRFWRWE